MLIVPVSSDYNHDVVHSLIQILPDKCDSFLYYVNLLTYAKQQIFQDRELLEDFKFKYLLNVILSDKGKESYSEYDVRESYFYALIYF